MLTSLKLHPSSPLTSFSTPFNPTPPLPSHFLRFRTSHRENFRYLKTLGIIDPNSKFYKAPPPELVDKILTTVEFFKSKGFVTADLQRLAFLCPELFHSDFDPVCIQPVFEFLATELQASPEQCKRLVVTCPELLTSDVDLCLRQTLMYLRSLGVEKLNVPTTQNAHLLNTRVPKLAEKVRFLRSVGLSSDEAATVCARFPAIFGYSVEHNLRRKVEFLKVMKMSAVEVLNEFPQYLGFSLKKRVVPRYLRGFVTTSENFSASEASTMTVTSSNSCSGTVLMQLYWNTTCISNMCLKALTAYSASASVSSTGGEDLKSV